jgi:hypothetical protein
VLFSLSRRGLLRFWLVAALVAVYSLHFPLLASLVALVWAIWIRALWVAFSSDRSALMFLWAF